MDIYAYAEDMNYAADYLDMHTGYTYHIQDYGRALKMGLPTPGILVTDGEGNKIGYAQKKETA